MTGISTQTGLNFIKNYDLNKDGLSKQELQNGKMNSCLGAMKSVISGDKQGFQSAMEALQFATVAEQNFDFLSQSSGTTPRGDNNAETISPHDLKKTASNDGNKGNLTPKDIQSQKQQNEQQQGPMQMMQKFVQAMMQMMGMGDQKNNTAKDYAGTNNNDTGASNNNSMAFAYAYTTPGGSASASASASTTENKDKFLL